MARTIWNCARHEVSIDLAKVALSKMPVTIHAPAPHCFLELYTYQLSVTETSLSGLFLELQLLHSIRMQLNGEIEDDQLFSWPSGSFLCFVHPVLGRSDAVPDLRKVLVIFQIGQLVNLARLLKTRFQLRQGVFHIGELWVLCA